MAVHVGGLLSVSAGCLRGSSHLQPCGAVVKSKSLGLRFLPQPEMRPSSIKTNPVESREAPPISTVSLTSHRHSALELSPSVESCGCGLGPSPVRLG